MLINNMKNLMYNLYLRDFSYSHHSFYYSLFFILCSLLL